MATQKHTSKKNTRGTRRSSRRLLYSVLLVVVLLGIGIFSFLAIHTPSPVISTKLTNTNDKPATVQTTNVPAPNTVVTTPKPTPTTNVPGGSTGSNVTSTATLTAPTGTFVSNHGSADQPVTASTQEASICITTSGATCSIQFTNSSGAVESLGAEEANTNGKDNQNGTTTWSWTPASLQLTSGTWTVTAVASLNGQTKTTPDETPLTIQ